MSEVTFVTTYEYADYVPSGRGASKFYFREVGGRRQVRMFPQDMDAALRAGADLKRMHGRFTMVHRGGRYGADGIRLLELMEEDPSVPWDEIE